jgi:hypothetical protein
VKHNTLFALSFAGDAYQSSIRFSLLSFFLCAGPKDRC